MYILGQLIHNNQVIEQLSALGIQTIDKVPEDGGGICIIRTHGAAPQTFRELEERGFKIIDATCPDVKRVQNKAKTLAQEGYRVVIIGKAEHPEVVAIKAYADLYSKKEALVISSVDEINKYINEIREAKKIGIVIQTTQKMENFKKVLPIIAENSKELKVHNTVCSATFKRQQEAIGLAKDVELMIVVGSRSSANTTHLAEILSGIIQTIHIENHEEIDIYRDTIEKTSKIGITAGASTPEFLINEVINKIGDLNT